MFGQQDILILEELNRSIVRDNIYDHSNTTTTVEVRHTLRTLGLGTTTTWLGCGKHCGSG